MTDPMSSADILAEIERLNGLYREAVAREEAEAASTRGDIGDSIAALDALLGPVGAAPGTDSIRAVAAYDDATIAEHAGLALRLILTGLEQLTQTTRDIASVIGSN